MLTPTATHRHVVRYPRLLVDDRRQPMTVLAVRLYKTRMVMTRNREECYYCKLPFGFTSSVVCHIHTCGLVVKVGSGTQLAEKPELA